MDFSPCKHYLILVAFNYYIIILQGLSYTFHPSRPIPRTVHKWYIDDKNKGNSWEQSRVSIACNRIQLDIRGSFRTTLKGERYVATWWERGFEARLVFKDNIQSVDDTGNESANRDIRRCSVRRRDFWRDRKWKRTYPRIVSRMLIRTSAPHPRSRKTPRGGRMTAKMIWEVVVSDSLEGSGFRTSVCESAYLDDIWSCERHVCWFGW